MFFWNSLAFSMIQQMLAIWSLVPLPFLKPAWISGSSRSHVVEAWLGDGLATPKHQIRDLDIDSLSVTFTHDKHPLLIKISILSAIVNLQKHWKRLRKNYFFSVCSYSFSPHLPWIIPSISSICCLSFSLFHPSFLLRWLPSVCLHL